VIELGFTVYLEKSNMIPSQLVQFLGFVLNSRNLVIRISPLKCVKVVKKGEERCQKELRLWIEHLHTWYGRLISPPPVEYGMQTNASILGWGGVCQSQNVGGRWSPKEQTIQINVLEARAAKFVIQDLFHCARDVHVRIKMDGTSAVA
jgi:hypothetical protein